MLMMNACPRWSLLTLPLLASLGCSDPVPLPARGRLTLEVYQVNPPVPQKACPAPGEYLIGDYNSQKMSTDSPSASNSGSGLINGDGSTKIQCSVKTSSNGGFDFSGSMNATTHDGSAVSITFDNGHMAADNTGTANVQLFTSPLLANFSSGSTPCTFQGIDVNRGHFFASMYCAQISSPPSSLCAIGTGPGSTATTFVVFENCDGSP
jgi:hypothetical protein